MKNVERTRISSSSPKFWLDLYILSSCDIFPSGSQSLLKDAHFAFLVPGRTDLCSPPSSPLPLLLPWARTAGAVSVDRTSIKGGS